MISRRLVTFAALIALVFIALFSSPVDAQIYFSDDFENPSESEGKWEVAGGEWQVADGVYHQLSTSSPWQASMVAADHWQDQWQEYTIEFKVKVLTEGDAPVNVLFRVQDPVPVVWDDRNGPNTHLYRWIVNGWTNTESRPYVYNEGTSTMLAQTNNTLEVGAWHHIKLVVTKTSLAGYVDDVEMFDVQHAAWTTGRVGIQAYSGMMDFDDLIIYGPFGLVGAAAPVPGNGEADVQRDGMLSWTPGAFAETHDVYLGADFADVNSASRSNPMNVLVSQGQTAATYDPGRLEFGQTYYWRIDEVNGAPDNTIFKGEIWSFDVEPFAYPIEHVTATASSAEEGAGPENTINGSGLDENNLHSAEVSDMWLSSMTGAQPTVIEFTFAHTYKLHEVLVWNYNVQFEAFLGYGFKDVTVEYSEDGVDRMVLGDLEFAQATSQSNYASNTTIDFGGLAVGAVRLTANTGWGEMFPQYGLSEVCFLHIPTQAHESQPADGATGVDVNADLSWRSGREAATHEVYLSTDSEAVSTGAALVDAVGTSSFAPDDLQFGTAYYWKINEVNEAEDIRVWESDLWTFSTQEFATIEDFESYNDEDNLIYETWLDGWGNETGSTVGYLEAPFAETSIIHGGRQSMPLEYINTSGPYYSEAERDLGGADWTARGADTLRLYVQGNADNGPGTLYVAVEDSTGNVAVVSYADEAVLTAETWQEWMIPFADLSGVNLAAVRTIYIGVGDRDNPTSGGTGTVFIDDIGFGHPAVSE